MIILGVDPGASGALAWIEADPTGGKRPRLIAVHDTPTVEVKVGTRTRTRIDVPTTANLVHILNTIHAPHIAVIETVGSRPGESVAASFSFGYATGAVAGIAAANGCDIVQITPQEWRRFARVTGDKNQAREVAAAFFPDHANLFKRKKDHGRADAVLIAFGWAIKNLY